MLEHLALRRQSMCKDRFENIRHEVRPQASPQANIRRQAGSYRGKEVRFVFLGDKPASES